MSERFKKSPRIAHLPVIAFAMMIMVTAIPVAFAAADDPVIFNDANFEAALKADGVDGNGDETITEGEMATLAIDLNYAAKEILDITGIQHATNLTSIDLSDNTIRDISALSAFSGITINISNNYLDMSEGSDDKAVADMLTANGCTIVNTGQKAIPVSGVTLSDESLSLKTGETAALTATVSPSDAANQAVAWHTDDANIATVSGGIVTAVAAGQTTISVICDDGGHTDTCTVTVTQPVTGISLTESAILLCTGDTHTLTADIAPADASNQTLSWVSGNMDVATVSDGVVTAVAAGSATITVTTDDGSFTDTCSVSVVGNVITSDTYTIANGTIHFVPANTSVNDFLSHIENNEQYLTILSGGEAYTKGSVGTGMTLRLTIGGTVKDEADILVLGDVNGDGRISISDYTLTRLDILDLKALIGLMKKAGDVNQNGAVTISDYTMMRLHILGLRPIDSSGPLLPEVTNPQIRKFLDIALAQAGKPYVWSAEGPDSFDCSGYVYYCLNQSGYRVYRTTADSYSKFTQWPYVSRENLQPGDLMFYHSDSIPGRIGHIGIYLGNGYHIHASSDYGYVLICDFSGWYDKMFSHGRRVFE